MEKEEGNRVGSKKLIKREINNLNRLKSGNKFCFWILKYQ